MMITFFAHGKFHSELCQSDSTAKQQYVMVVFLCLMFAHDIEHKETMTGALLPSAIQHAASLASMISRTLSSSVFPTSTSSIGST